MNVDVQQTPTVQQLINIVQVAIQPQRSVKNQALMMNVKVSTRQHPFMIPSLIPVLNVLRTEIVRGQLLNA